MKKEKQKSPLDLNEIFPGYIKKSVFRGVVFIMILFTIFVYVSNDYHLSFKFLSCPDDSPIPCEYTNITEENKNDINIPVSYLQPGETIGNVPNFWAEWYNTICLIFVFFGFIINHLLYYKRSKTLRIPFNNESWKKYKKKINKIEDKIKDEN